MTPEQTKAAHTWIDGARSLIEQHRRGHDALYDCACMCTVCMVARRLLESYPITEPPSDPRISGDLNWRGGLPK